MPCLWPVACLSDVPHGPVWWRRASSPVLALAAPVGFPDTMVPYPIQNLLGGYAGHMGAGREPGSLCLPLTPTPGEGAELSL